jgi:hypothetical protein
MLGIVLSSIFDRHARNQAATRIEVPNAQHHFSSSIDITWFEYRPIILGYYHELKRRKNAVFAMRWDEKGVCLLSTVSADLSKPSDRTATDERLDLKKRVLINSRVCGLVEVDDTI